MTEARRIVEALAGALSREEIEDAKNLDVPDRDRADTSFVERLTQATRGADDLVRRLHPNATEDDE